MKVENALQDLLEVEKAKKNGNDTPKALPLDYGRYQPRWAAILGHLEDYADFSPAKCKKLQEDLTAEAK